MDSEKLLSLACRAAENSYSPYSGFRVGAALECRDGSVYTGCNIENSAFTPTVCAERTAFFKAVSEGKRDFVRIAVWGGDTACPPCGVCRQVMSEFCGEDFEIILNGEKHTLSQILPLGFRLEKKP